MHGSHFYAAFAGSKTFYTPFCHMQSERKRAAIKVAYTSRERVAVRIKKSRAENKQAKTCSLFKYIPGRKVLTPVCISAHKGEREARDV
jgi:hypothetical protein